MEKNNILSGNVFKGLLKFTIPVFIAMFLQSLYGAVDLLVVGQFADTVDTSGVSTGSMLMHTITMIITGLSMGITIFVGQKIGENKKEEASKAIGSGIAMFILIGLIFSILIILFAKPLAILMKSPPTAISQTTSYIRVCGFGFLFICMYNLLGAIFRGLGDSKTPLIIVLIACIINIIGDLLFVLVFKMGATGAAFATIIAQGISVIISVLLIKKKNVLHIKLNHIKLNKNYNLTEFKLGFPIALQELLVGLSFLVIQAVANSMDLSSSAGVGVAEKVCAFIMLVPSSFSQAMSAYVAQNIGAGNNKRANKALKYGIITSLCVGLVIGSFTFIRGDLLASIFTKDSNVILKAHSYLKAYAIDTIFTAFLFCFIGYFNGRGKTFFVMLQGIIGAILIRVPIVIVVNNIAGSTLFHIGLATPASTVIQIIMCIIYMILITKNNNIKYCILAGGCFWCMSKPYYEYDGINHVYSGYSGGKEKNPKYEDVKAQKTSHKECIKLVYDSTIISYKQILDIYFDTIDPFDFEGQFIDRGESYTTAIFYKNNSQKILASNYIKDIELKFNKPVATKILKETKFYMAEEYHQDFAINNKEEMEKELIVSGRKQRSQ